MKTKARFVVACLTITAVGLFFTPMNGSAQDRGPLRFRVNTEEKEAVKGRVRGLVSIGADKLIAHSEVPGNAMKGPSQYLTTIDVGSLKPILEKKIDLQGKYKDHAIEDLFVHNGQAYLLVTFQDIKGGHTSLCMLAIDPNTLALGAPDELLHESGVESLGDGLLLQDHGAQPLGYSVRPLPNVGGIRVEQYNWSKEWVLGKLTGSSATMRWMDLDPKLESGPVVTPEINASGVLDGIEPSFTHFENGSTIGAFGSSATGASADPVTLNVLYLKDGSRIEATSAFPTEHEPVSLEFTALPDGKLLGIGVYSKRQSKNQEGRLALDDRAPTLGIFTTIFDPAKKRLDPPVLVPIVDKEGKQVDNLGTTGPIELDGGELLVAVHPGVLFVKINKSGEVVSTNEMTGATPGGSSLVKINGAGYLVWNDNPAHPALRAAGKTKIASVRTTPSYVTITNNLDYKEYYAPKLPNTFPLIHAGRLFDMGGGRFAAVCPIAGGTTMRNALVVLEPVN